MKIAISGLGYVGLSNTLLLAQHNEVVALGVVPKKAAMINRRESPIVDVEIEDYLKNRPLNLAATTDKAQAYKGGQFVIMATPTTYDPDIVIYEPGLESDTFFNSAVIRDLAEFKSISDVILTNRTSPELADVANKIYTRDLFGTD